VNKQDDFTKFSKQNFHILLDREYFEDCGIGVNTEIEYCETPKGIHFIVTHINSGKLLPNAEIDNFLKRNNNIVLEVLKQNSNLKPTLTLVYDVTGVTNFTLMNLLPFLFKSNRYANEINNIAIPLGYKGFIAIMPPRGKIVLEKTISIIPSKGLKPSTLIFKDLAEAEPALDLIRHYGLVF
jgi:hypothetical protein